MIRVQLFARYAELLGTESLSLPREGIRTVGDLLARLRELPGGGDLGPSALVAVNLKQARADEAVGPDDEVALLPPMAGG